jgi:hypothetical protein
MKRATHEAGSGLQVAAFARGVVHPRQIVVQRNDDVGNVVWRVSAAP